MDPLNLLRECVRNKQPIVYDPTKPNDLTYGGSVHNRDQLTHFKSKKGKGPPYSLGALWYFWVMFLENNEENKTVDHGVYMREAKKIGVPYVSLVDKQEVTAFFRGQDQSGGGDIGGDLSDMVEPVLKKQKTGSLGDFSQGESMQVESASGTKERDARALTAEGGLTEDQIDALKQKLRDRKKSAGGKAMDVEGTTHASSTAFDRQDDAVESMFEKSQRSRIVKDIREREKALCTSQSILQTDGKPFSQCLLKIQSMIQKEKKLSDQQKARNNAKPHSRYDKVADADYWKEQDMAVEGLDTRGTMTFDFGAQNSNNNNEQKKAEFSYKPTTPISSAASTPSTQSKKRALSEVLKTPDGRFRVEKPIIIIPGKSTQSLINLNNVKQFLIDFNFIHPSEIREPLRESKLDVEFSPKHGQAMKITLVDNVSELRSRDWANVVAIFVHGQEWQFKPFPKEWGGVAGIFNRAKGASSFLAGCSRPGFYMYFDDEKVPSTVSSWNVKPLSVNKNKRHLDGTAAKKFWDELELELKKRNY